MQQFTSTLTLDCHEWRYVKVCLSSPSTTSTSSNGGQKKQTTATKSTSPSSSLRENIRLSRAVLNSAPSLLAIPSEGATFSDSSAFFILHPKTQDNAELQRVLSEIRCTETWIPPESELDSGVPFTLFQEAVKFAVVNQLNRKGWVRIGMYLVKMDSSLGQIPTSALFAVKMVFPAHFIPIVKIL